MKYNGSKRAVMGRCRLVLVTLVLALSSAGLPGSSAFGDNELNRGSHFSSLCVRRVSCQSA